MSPKNDDPPFAYNGLDRIFHEKARLGVMSSLVGRPDGLTFSDLKSLCGPTDGNLSRHLQILEEAGCIEIKKGFDGRRPCTRCTLTDEGRLRFSEYLQVLEEILRNADLSADAVDETAVVPGRAFFPSRR